ncbi:MAG: hypothetical protein R6W97_00425 [Thiobacillus sp.]
MNASAIVYVGTVNWRHPTGWSGFYPDDLPEDWMLSYYNTQFQAVYLPASVWTAASAATWVQWLNDTQEGFCFVLEPDDAGGAPPASERVLIASPAWLADHVWWLDEAPDMRALAQRLTRHVAAGTPLFVFSRSGNLALLGQVNSLREVMGY